MSPNGSHPIFELMQNMETAWEACKLARASKTLDEAITEYKRWYKRLPPCGFDNWCTTPTGGTICHNLEPFWGIGPYHLAITQELEQQRDHYYTQDALHFETADIQ
ncbi:glycosyltransferase family 90 protein [Paxillus involutus ATCC 200175]|uniref:Glycosyltransferase family 90 protein n=1 Tax=Paxillus involutus ATCC 200175 TaxID=664439 RepID=A0A0C9TGX4_PAXIN|nr:glycosyltransferase family 90 protein [Paxillus involutus ATCC 200175]